MSALCKAIEQKRFRQAKLLVELGADVNRRDESSGKTPLVVACSLENEALACQISRCLLKHGADVKRKDREGMTALMHACRLSKEKLARELLKTQECDLHTTDKEGNTALMHSIMAGNSGVVKTLTETLNRYQLRGVDIPNNTGETPLIKAAKLGRTECTRVLLTDGKASPNARDLHWRLTASEWQELIASDKRSIQDGFTSAVQHPPGAKQISHTGDQLNEKTWQSITSRIDECGVTKSLSNHACENNGDSKKIMDITKMETSKESGFESQRSKMVKATKQDSEPNQTRLRAGGVRSVTTDRDSSIKQVLRDSSFVSEDKRGHRSSQRGRTLKIKVNKVQEGRLRGNDVADATRECLPNLLNVLAHQNSPSFRPSVKPPPPETFPETEAELRDKIMNLWFSGAQRPARNSFALEHSASLAGGRLSKAARAARAWRRFSSIYSQGDFTILRGERPGAQRDRRLSLATSSDSRTRANASRQARRLSTQNEVPPAKFLESRLDMNVQRRRDGQQRRHSGVSPSLFSVKESTCSMGSVTRYNALNTQPNGEQRK